MKPNWPTRTLADVCQIESTFVDPRKQEFQDLPHVGGANIEPATGRLVALRTARAEGLKSGKFLFDERVVLYSKIRPYLEKVACPDFPGLCSADIYPLAPIPGQIARDFLFYLLLSADFTRYAVSGSSRAGMPKVNRNHLFHFRFDLPPLAEQARLSAVLREAFDGIEAITSRTATNAMSSRELFESHLQDMTAESASQRGVTPLSLLATEVSDGDHSPPPKVSKGIPFVTISNIEKATNAVDFDETFFVTREYFDKVKTRRRPQRGDILYTVTGSYGIPVLVDFDREFCFQRHIGLIRPSSQVDPKWLYYMLRSPQTRRQADESATGTAQKTVSLGALRAFSIPKTLRSEQVAMVEELDAVSAETRRLEADYVRKLALLDELRQSLLHAAFNGDL